MVYLFGAFLVLWALVFGYLFSLRQRQQQLERDLTQLCERLGVSEHLDPQDDE